jgi:hypothetical protein
MLQLAPGASVVQLLVPEKSLLLTPVMVVLIDSRVVLPKFVSVTVCGLLLVPTA